VVVIFVAVVVVSAAVAIIAAFYLQFVAMNVHCLFVPPVVTKTLPPLLPPPRPPRPPMVVIPPPSPLPPPSVPLPDTAPLDDAPDPPCTSSPSTSTSMAGAAVPLPTIHDRRRQHGVWPRETGLAVQFWPAISVSYPLERIPGGAGDKWAVVRMMGAWYR